MKKLFILFITLFITITSQSSINENLLMIGPVNVEYDNTNSVITSPLFDNDIEFSIPDSILKSDKYLIIKIDSVYDYNAFMLLLTLEIDSMRPVLFKGYKVINDTTNISIWCMVDGYEAFLDEIEKTRFHFNFGGLQGLNNGWYHIEYSSIENLICSLTYIVFDVNITNFYTIPNDIKAVETKKSTYKIIFGPNSLPAILSDKRVYLMTGQLLK